MEDRQAIVSVAVYPYHCFDVVVATLVTGYLQGKWAFLRGISRTLRARAEVQRMRKVRDSDLLVGGPLTIAPQLDRGGARSLALRALDLGLRGWWTLVRPLC